MKFVQITSTGQRLGDIASHLFDRLRNQTRLTKPEAMKESFIFVRDHRATNLKMFVKDKSMVTLLIPEKFFNSKVFTVRENNIAYEDAEIVVVDKPAGLSTQGTRMLGEEHLFGALIAYYTKDHPSRLSYVGMHHRIDRDTSGLLLFTKKGSMNKSISEQFKKHKIVKKYVAIVEGEKPEKEEWVVKAPIARVFGKTNRDFRFGIDKKKGEPAETRFKWLKTLGPNRQLIECQPITGRTHQIRIHLQSCGLPTVGDRVYGVKTEGRMMLHAHSLEFVHPKTGKLLKIYSKSSL